MADPQKIRKQDSDDEECIVEDLGSDNESSVDDDMEVNEEIQIDFEGFGIVDSDFHGVRQMLQQLFPKDHVDVSDLANMIIGQNFIGTVLKQSECDEDMSDDSDELDQVFGVTTCLSCSRTSASNDSMSSLIKFLLEKCEIYCTNGKMKTQFKQVLQQENKNLHSGWIVNERFINIPPQVALPMFEKVMMELSEASARKHKTRYDFTHYVMICKTYSGAAEASGDGKKMDPKDLQFINSEEELFFDECQLSFTYPVQGAAPLVSNAWNEESPEMMPSRTVLLLEKDSVMRAISNLRTHLSEHNK